MRTTALLMWALMGTGAALGRSAAPNTPRCDVVLPPGWTHLTPLSSPGSGAFQLGHTPLPPGVRAEVLLGQSGGGVVNGYGGGGNLTPYLRLSHEGTAVLAPFTVQFTYIKIDKSATSRSTFSLRVCPRP